jgi:DNA-binding NarL/FixJ family response regulator
MNQGLPKGAPPSLVAYELGPGRILFVHDLATASKVDGLGAAEQEVLTLLLRGYANRTIAETRGTSQRTVENQVRCIFRKLGVQSRAELTAKLFASG